MSCIDQAQITRWQTRIARKEAILDSLYDSMDAAVSNPNQRYRLDSGIATQSAWLRPYDEMRETATIIEQEIDNLAAKLKGCGIVYARVNRKAC